MSLSRNPVFAARSASSMRLSLQRPGGDHNGNAFPVSSSSSSSASSSCFGESSPESLRSLSGLQSPSPDLHSPSPDLHIFLSAAVHDPGRGGDVVVTKWPPDEEEAEQGERSNLVQTVSDRSESNDNSVYVDASSGRFAPEIWNENITLALSTNSARSVSDSDGERKRSSTPDSTTEIPEDEEEEALFLSIGSDLEGMSLTAIVAARWASKQANGGTTHQKEEDVSDLDSETQSSDAQNRNMSKMKPDNYGKHIQTKTSHSAVNKDNGPRVTGIPKAGPPRAGPPRGTATARPLLLNQAKPPGPEVSRSGRVDLKNVKSKVSSWASPTKTNNQTKPSPVHSRRPAPITAVPNAIANAIAKPQRPPLSPMKVAILRPLKGKSRSGPSPGLDHRTRSRSVSSTGSEETNPPPRARPEDKGKEVMDKKLGTTSSTGPRGTKPEGPGPGPGPGPGAAGSPTRTRPSPGIPKPRFAADRSLSSAASSVAVKTSTNQPLAPPSRPAPSAASKLPVKGLPTSLSSSSLGSNANENNTGDENATRAPEATESEERPNRGPLPVGSQSTARPPSDANRSSAMRTPSFSDSNRASPMRTPSFSDSNKASPMRSRAQSLQNRPPLSTGLKSPSVANSNMTKTVSGVGQSGAKTPPSAQSPIKHNSHNALQRSGSTRLHRINSTVDKNKREVHNRVQNQNQGPNQNQVQSQTPTPATDAVSASSRVPSSDSVGKPKTTSTAAAVRHSPKASPRVPPGAPRSAAPVPEPGAPRSTAPVPAEEVRQSREQAERQRLVVEGLKRLLQQNNSRTEALAVVVQHLSHEREETLKQKKELVQELSVLRDELVSSSQSVERLQKEKEEVKLGLEDKLDKLKQQHQEEQEQLEDRLRRFFQEQWDKAQQLYQEEADRFREQTERQVQELRSRQEVERSKQEETHSQNMDALKQQHQADVEELRTTQRTELDKLEESRRETEATLSERISELTSEKESLSEKLLQEEERRKKILNDKSLKDSATLYLEQELESLKVVLEIKNNQLHQKEKKLMEMDKLMEANIKLEECLTKVQQENEDYRARMDRHAALSKQLSSEHTILQQTLQKESKVNKRLSMENEELLWKLHNGDLLASPRRLSPTSPFGSPRNSAAFASAAVPTAAPLSPR